MQIMGVKAKCGPMAYGLWRFAGSDVYTAQHKIETALASGFTLMDNADIYGYNGSGSVETASSGFGAAEKLQGDVLAAAPHLRDQMIIATKGGVYLPGPYRSDKEYLVNACDQSLTRLGVDVIDLYQIHRPDHLTSHSEVAAALNSLHQAGKIRACGVSNYTPDQCRALQSFLDMPLVSTQPELSALTQDSFFDGTGDYAQQARLTVLAWSPLAGGALTSFKAAKAHSDQAVRVYQALDGIAKPQQAEAWQVALKFIMMHPTAPIPIIGTQTPARITQSQQAEHVEINRAQWYEIITAWRGIPLP